MSMYMLELRMAIYTLSTDIMNTEMQLQMHLESEDHEIIASITRHLNLLKDQMAAIEKELSKI